MRSDVWTQEKLHFFAKDGITVLLGMLWGPPDTPVNDSPASVKSGPSLYFLHNKLRWLLISFKELWMKTESARSSLRTTARSTCEYTLKLTSSLILFILTLIETATSFQCTISLGFYILPRRICRDEAKASWFNFCNFHYHKMKAGWGCTKSSQRFLILRLNWRKVW